MSSWKSLLDQLRDIIQRIPEFKGSVDSITEEKEEIRIRRKPKKLPTNIEPKQIFDIQSASSIEIDYFMDGVQRTTFLGYIFKAGYMFPVQHHLSAVVILDRELKPILETRPQSKLLIPRRDIVPRNLLSEFQDQIYVPNIKATYDYMELRKKLYEASSHLRDDLERQTLREFLDSIPKNEILGIDGTIPGDGKIAAANVVGIVKTHYTRYLRIDDEKQIFQMSPGMRSWCFKIQRPDLKNKSISYDIISWYLKIHEFTREPYAGILRLEINPGLKSKISEISKDIFELRFPIQCRGADWDRKLYHIHVCELRAKALLPSINSIKAEFKDVL